MSSGIHPENSAGFLHYYFPEILALLDSVLLLGIPLEIHAEGHAGIHPDMPRWVSPEISFTFALKITQKKILHGLLNKFAEEFIQKHRHSFTNIWRVFFF